MMKSWYHFFAILPLFAMPHFCVGSHVLVLSNPQIEALSEKIRSAFSADDIDGAAEHLSDLLALVSFASSPSASITSSVSIESPYDYFQMQLPLLIEESNHPAPLKLALNLAANSKLKRRPGDKVDLIAMVVRAAAECVSDFGQNASLIDAEMAEKAAILCKRYARRCVDRL